MARVNNLPSNIKEKYIVARDCDGSLWFWGAWDDSFKANNVAVEIGGVVIENKGE